ncbi:MAG TPA: hypothetical protein VFN75_01010, partial [Pseudonocardiaceae bacterium]|nr:hypothetical protein [Pseudonocardiaceae bacterium]
MTRPTASVPEAQEIEMPHQPGDHAVVLGASMAGLLATRVLADTYRNVTVIDRDAMPKVGEHRRGV